MLRRRGIVRIVITLLLIYALLCFARSGRSLAALEKTAADLREQRISLEQERAQLQLLQQADPARMDALEPVPVSGCERQGGRRGQACGGEGGGRR